MYDGIFPVGIAAISSLALIFLVGGSGLMLIGSPILQRSRTRPIRMREYPAWECWVATHYPKATKDEAEVIRRIVGSIAGDARVEPAQLLPQDRLSGFALPSEWEFFIGLHGESNLSDEMEALLDEFDVDPGERSLRPGEKTETVGDAIVFMLKRTCSSSRRSGPA